LTHPPDIILIFDTQKPVRAAMHVLRIRLKQLRSTFLKQGKGAECNKTPFYDIIYYVNHSTFFKVWRDRKENMETPTKCLLLLREKATVWCTVGGNDNN